jgi:hypothetical protein
MNKLFFRIHRKHKQNAFNKQSPATPEANLVSLMFMAVTESYGGRWHTRGSQSVFWETHLTYVTTKEQMFLARFES